MAQIPDIVVVGCPSVDRLQGPTGDHRSVTGGAAFITAAAAHRAGAAVGLVARVPADLPQEVERALAMEGFFAEGLVEVPDPLPGFHITYDLDGRATYRGGRGGAEGAISTLDLPSAWLAARIAHISPLAGSTERQLAFAGGLRAAVFQGLISAGTFLRAVYDEPSLVRDLAGSVDIFFCNREEAEVLWGGAPPQHEGRICVTDGPRAVEIWTAGALERRPVEPAEPVDPTGAGDAFCGGFLAGLVLGVDPCCRGLAQSRAVMRGLGVAPLLSRRARVDGARVEEVAALLPGVAGASAFTFCGFPFPEEGDPLAAEILAAATLHQYGFWTAAEEGWEGPMWATAAGRRFKGSDFVWQGFTRAAARDPSILSPARAAEDPRLIPAILADDHGRCPLPDLESHVRLHQAWGRSLPSGGFTAILREALAAPRPLAALLSRLAALPGYAEDPLQKKATLLALVLSRRPEGLLPVTAPESLGPVVDYHIMRAMLRTGCVHIPDGPLREALASRSWVDAAGEDEVREASWQAVRAICRLSGLSMGEVDGFFFANGRSACGEVEPPRCAGCPIRTVCGRHGDLFQPVFRTTAY